MESGVQERMMKQSVAGIEEGILQDQYRQITDGQNPPVDVTGSSMQLGETVGLQPQQQRSGQGKNHGREHRQVDVMADPIADSSALQL